MKILVVDDALTIRRSVELALEGLDVELITAGGAPEGIRRLREHPDVSLLLTDVNMPGMSGVEMLEAMGEEGLPQGLVVAMLTTERQRDLVARARAAGASAWICKPFKPHLLRSAVEQLLGLDDPA